MEPFRVTFGTHFFQSLFPNTTFSNLFRDFGGLRCQNGVPHRVHFRRENLLKSDLVSKGPKWDRGSENGGKVFPVGAKMEP